MEKKKVIQILIIIAIALFFVILGGNFTNTNKIAEELGMDNLKTFSLGNSKQIENILPDKNVISIFNLGYFINDELGLSIFSITRLIALIFLTYNFMNCFINEKKIKIAGVLGIVLSSLFLMDNANLIIDIFIFSELSIISIQKNLNNKKGSLLWSVLLAFSIISIFLLRNIELLIISLLIIIPLSIYIFINSKEKNNKKAFFISLIFSLIIGIIILIVSRNGLIIEAKNENRYLFNILNYFNTTFLGFADIDYLSTYVNIYSLFPIPIVLAMMLLLKSDKKENDFLFMILIICTYLIIGICVNFPEIISKILLIGFISNNNIIILIHLFNFLALLYMLDKCKMDISISSAITLIFISVILTVFASRPEELSSTIYLIISAGIFAVFGYMICRKDDERYKKLLSNSLIIYFVIVGLTQINITFGADILKNQEINSYISSIGKVEETKWIVLNTNYVLPEYLDNLGLDVINIDARKINKEKFSNMTEIDEKILWEYYNEALFEIGGENILSLNENSVLKIEISKEYLEELGIDYIITNSKLEGKNAEYSNEKIYIYKF